MNLKLYTILVIYHLLLLIVSIPNRDFMNLKLNIAVITSGVVVVSIPNRDFMNLKPLSKYSKR